MSLRGGLSPTKQSKISTYMAGYSETPLLKKLGIKAEMKVTIINPPADLPEEIHNIPEVRMVAKPTKEMDFILFFSDSKKELEKNFAKLGASLKTNGMLWIGWPKKASKIPTDLTENIIREFGLANGLVDVKVCAITEKWSGLKFVIILKNRSSHFMVNNKLNPF
jgi:hypothetical protein